MKRPRYTRLLHDILRVLCRNLGLAFFRIRAFDRDLIPKQGGMLVVSNHQSHLDPVLVGLCFDRRMNYLARQTLFGFAPFRWLIHALDAIPIDRDGLGLGGLKESLRRLKNGEILLIFPEGTRTRDGEVGRLKSGFLTLARRANVPLVPVAIDGAYDSWPRKNVLPQTSVIHLQFGPPMLPEEVAAMDDESVMREIENRIRQCHAQARHYRQLGQQTW